MAVYAFTPAPLTLGGAAGAKSAQAWWTSVRCGLHLPPVSAKDAADRLAEATDLCGPEVYGPDDALWRWRAGLTRGGVSLGDYARMWTFVAFVRR